MICETLAIEKTKHMNSEPLILALDQGTSSSRAAIFDANGEMIASESVPLKVDYPRDGWVEQNPEEIWESQVSAMKKVKERLTESQYKSVICCGITNQRETTILWRRNDSKPCGPALVWQDGRTANICAEWKKDGLEKEWCHRTGLLLDPYFSASKISWLLQNESAASDACNQSNLCFGTVETWLLWNLTSEKNHFSDMSNASRTLLMDIENLSWEKSFCENILLPEDSLPELVPCRGDFGRIKEGLPFSGVPIQGILGDQQAATFGQLCFQSGEAKCTYGTGAFLVVNTGDKIFRSKSGLLSTIGWTNSKGEPTYCLEGSLFNAGTVIQWFRDGLQIINNAKDVNILASQVKSSEGLMCVPAFTGYGTPHWDPAARGLIIGITRDTNRSHIARAGIEGIALSVSTLLELAEEAMKIKLSVLAVDGGAAASDLLLQAQADSIGINVRRADNLESTARGVALLAGMESGLIQNTDSFEDKSKKSSKVFTPKISAEQRSKWRKKWEKAVERSLEWYEEN